MDDVTWPGDWMRAALTNCVLAVLCDGPAHGYALAQQLAKSGLGAVKGGTLYPLLTRLEVDGQVQSRWIEGEAGPGRKVFQLTPRGRELLNDQATRWLVFAGRVNAVLVHATEAKD